MQYSSLILALCESFCDLQSGIYDGSPAAVAFARRSVEAAPVFGRSDMHWVPTGCAHTLFEQFPFQQSFAFIPVYVLFQPKVEAESELVLRNFQVPYADKCHFTPRFLLLFTGFPVRSTS